MKNESKIPTWDELLASMSTSVQHPADTAWSIYRYLNAYHKEMSSEEARTLLASYMKIPLAHPSLLHSCVLGTALKMAAVHDSFNLPAFLKMWGFPANLRPEDMLWRTLPNGRTVASLRERTERAVREYRQRHIDTSQKTIGYVDRYDAKHKHYHIFDPLSRHFVAIDPPTPPTVGSYVRFAPVIPEKGNFKTAVALSPENHHNGRRAFGIMKARVKYINLEKEYFAYELLSPISPTPEGEITKEGYANLSLAGSAQLTENQEIHIILFLKRGKDGKKRNYIAEIIL
ncbi:hypothetical protein HPS57_05675 [Prevotella sp. PINT]|jgi:hypothetical protein|uniref:hypothetical protein n=1 Tax=Palleniella intestinalis TaxID=2736291 RepID=UPI001553DF9D|nr:hypothetical protein [Palleniella intestinalis]NPD81459.1 hypothetical protein [Palleniella intestinalis]